MAESPPLVFSPLKRKCMSVRKGHQEDCISPGFLFFFLRGVGGGGVGGSLQVKMLMTISKDKCCLDTSILGA